MRVVTIFLVAAIGVLSYFLYQPAHLQKLTNDLQANWQHIFFDKKLNFDGLSTVTEAEIRKFLPVERSNLWWLFKFHDVERQILELGLVEDVRVARCEGLTISCFNVSILERQPKLIVLSGEQAWVVGDDGGFIKALPAATVKANLRAMHERGVSRVPAIVRGIDVAALSPDLVKARLQYVKRSVDFISSDLNLPVEWVSLRDNGELEFKFVKFKFSVTFDNAAENFDRLREEVARLTQVLKELKGSEGGVRSIDLAFNRLAVVKLAGQGGVGQKAAPESK